jgi:hypothetical protein
MLPFAWSVRHDFYTPNKHLTPAIKRLLVLVSVVCHHLRRRLKHYIAALPSAQTLELLLDRIGTPPPPTLQQEPFHGRKILHTRNTDARSATSTSSSTGLRRMHGGGRA